MVRSRKRSAATTEPVRRLRNPRIGFIGKGTLTPKETGVIWYIGRCIARLGHTLVLVPAKGAATAMREGAEVEEGTLETLKEGVIESADHTLIYPDAPLLKKLEEKYIDLHTRTDVAVITQDNLDEWYNAVREVVTEKGLPLPD